jgi:cell division protein FtsI (penicillin-binding protein 3)
MRTTPLLLTLIATAGLAAPRPTPDVQRLVDQEVARLARLPGTRLAMVAVLEPSGRVLALGGQRGEVVDRELPATLRRDPGSVMKAFTLGAALEAGLVTRATVVSGEGGRWTLGSRVIEDASGHQAMTVDDVAAFSSNVGTAKVFALLGPARLEATLRALGIPTPPMPDAEAAVGVSFGADVTPTPLEVARAYAAIASGRAFPRQHAEVVALLQQTVDRDDGTGHRARIPGVAVAGKTGTCAAEGGVAYADFVGFLPAGDPRYVVLVGLETSARGYAGGTVAAPAFARLGARLAGTGSPSR